LIQIFKIINSFDDISVDKFFNINDNVTRAGHLFKLEKQHVRTTLRLNSFPGRCFDNWNSLTEDIVSSNSVLSFKTKLDKQWLDKRLTPRTYIRNTGTGTIS